jgi:hypothetical protein
MAGLTHLDDKEIAGLQAADLLAAETREMSNEVMDDPDYDIQPKKDGGIIFAVACADRDTLTKSLNGERVWVTRREIRSVRKNGV